MLPVPLWLPTRQNRQLHQALHTLQAYVDRQIAEHSRAGPAAEDLLAMLMAARDGTTGERLSSTNCATRR